MQNIVTGENPERLLGSELTQALVALLSTHLQPSIGGHTVLVGPQVRALADCLASGFSDHRFDTTADPHSLLVGLAERDTSVRPESYELICFVDAFTRFDKLQQEHVLSLARNLLTSRVLHLELPTADDRRWQLTDSLALGYRLVGSGQTEQTHWQLYEFNIVSYKATPGWLNADQWSNPQNWDRFRW